MREQFFITIAYLEQVHARCTRLRQLKIIAKLMADDDSVSLSDIEHVKPVSAVQSVSLPERRVWDVQNVCHGPWFRYITKKYPSLKSLDIGACEQRRFARDDLLDTNRTNPPFRHYFPQLNELSISEFAGMPSTTWPLLMKDIPKVSLSAVAMPSFTVWINDDATHGITNLSLSTIPIDLRGLENCKHLQELTLESGAEPESQEGDIEFALDVVLTCCPTLKKLKICGTIISHDNNHATAEAQVSPLEYLVLIKSALSNRTLAHVARCCPHTIHLDIRWCTWVDPSDDYPVIRLDFSQHRLSFFRLVSPWICTETRPTNVFAGDFRPEFRQDRHTTNSSPESSDCFMLKTEENGKNDFLLFGTGPLSIHPEATMTRLHDNDITSWLNNPDDTSLDQVQNAKQAIASLRYFRDSTPLYKNWSTVLSCRTIDLLYYNGGRLNLNDDDFYSTDRKFRRVTPDSL